MSTSRTPAQAVADLKADVLADVTQAKQAVATISTTAKADFQKLIADIETTEGVSMDAVKSVLGIK